MMIDRLRALPESLRSLIEILPERPTISQALGRLGRTDLDAYRILGTLQDRGLIRVRPGAK